MTNYIIADMHEDGTISNARHVVAETPEDARRRASKMPTLTRVTEETDIDIRPDPRLLG